MAVMPSAQTSAPSAPSVPLSELRVVSLPEQELVNHLSDRVPGFRYVLWDMAGDPVGARADEIDVAISQMEGIGQHVVDHAGRLLALSGRLGRILAEGIAARDASS